MSRDSDANTDGRIGRCTRADGDVRVAHPGGAEKPLMSDADIRTGDKLLSGDDSVAGIRLSDGTVIMLGPDSTLSIERFDFESDDDDDGAQFALALGTFVIEAGDLAIGADDFLLTSGDSAFGLRGARVAVRVDPLGYDLVTLLPSLRGPLGEVLAHNKIGVQVLNRAYQTLRLGGADADIPAPLTLPSGVLHETYGVAGIGEVLFPAKGVAESAGNDDPDQAFQAFETLHDRFLERQFISRKVFPHDGPEKTGDGDRMLEDAFDGTRFRLSRPEPEATD